jgi:hypothetical protein
LSFDFLKIQYYQDFEYFMILKEGLPDAYQMDKDGQHTQDLEHWVRHAGAGRAETPKPKRKLFEEGRRIGASLFFLQRSQGYAPLDLAWPCDL